MENEDAPRRAAACLSLVIPAWNEDATIGQALDEAGLALSALTAEYEILVVDDGSHDATATIVRRHAAADPRIRLIQHAENRGYGAALKTGFLAARYELVSFTDADCQFHLADLEYLLPLAQRYEIVNGCRIDRKDPALRRFASWGYNSLVRLLLGSPVHDLDCALKVFRREALLKILPQADNFFANTEMFAAAQQAGLSVVEVGVRHRPRAGGASKVSWKAIPKTLHTLLPHWWTQVMFCGPATRDAGSSRGFWLGLIVLAVAAGLQLFTDLNYPLLEPDEGRYAEIGRETLLHEQWIVPTLHQQPYLDKPPLFYWLLAASFRCFGLHDWAARLVPAGASWLTLLAMYTFGRRMVGLRAAFLASMSLGMTAGFVLCGRFLILDSLLALWVCLAMFTAWEACRGTRLKWSWWMLSAGCCGLGMLTKGPVALALCLPPVALHLWLTRSPLQLHKRHWIAYLAAASAVFLPWFVAIATVMPEFLPHFIWEHHLRRFTDGLNHPGPAWYYVPVLILGGFPWTLMTGAGLWFQFAPARELARLRSSADGFCLLWAMWCVAFFSMASCKLPSYVLPAIPALFLLLGVFVDQAMLHATGGEWLAWVRREAPRMTVAAMALALMTLIGLHYAAPWQNPWIAVAGSGLAAVALLVAQFGDRRRSAVAIWATCSLLAWLAIYDGSHRLLPAWAASRSPLPQQGIAADLLHDRSSSIAIYSGELGSVPFYLNRDDVPVYAGNRKHQLRQFLAERPSSLLITHYREDPDSLEGVVPRGMQLTRIEQRGRMSIWRVQSRDTVLTSQRSGGAAPASRQ